MEEILEGYWEEPQWWAQEGGENDSIPDRTDVMTECAKVEFLRTFFRTKSNIPD